MTASVRLTERGKLVLFWAAIALVSFAFGAIIVGVSTA